MRIGLCKGAMLCGAAAFVHTAAVAQDTGPGAGSGGAGAGQTSSTAAPEESGLRDIVVTARKTSENLQTTPVAVTAVDPIAIQQRQLVTVTDLQRATPNLSIGGAGTGPSSIVYLAIRGNAQNSPNSASDAAVGVYVDGVYQGRPIASNLGLLDLASAQVLRGTQGTLFGRNTTGGALLLTTTKPGGDFEGYVRGGYGNFNSKVIEGAVTVPLQGDQLGIRLAARYDDRNGYGFNAITNKDLGAVTSDFTARATVRWAPDSLPVELIVIGDYTRLKDTGTLYALVGVNPTGPLATLYPGIYSPTFIQNRSNFYTQYGRPATGDPEVDVPSNFNEAKGVSGDLKFNLSDEISLRSITAYRTSTSYNSMDLDGTPAQVASFFTRYYQKQFSEELQLSGKHEGFEWIVGAFYFRESGTERSDSFILQNAKLPIPNFPLVNLQPSNRNLGDFFASSKAVFAQANYNITDRLRFTGGFRYTWDTRRLNRHGINNIGTTPETIFSTTTFSFQQVPPGRCTVGPNAGTTPPTPCNDPRQAKFHYPAWTAGFDYKLTDDVFIYAKTGGAAMSGGFNTRGTPPGLEAFFPEKVKDVEAGFKGEFLDRRLRTNIAGFYNWRNGAQNIVNEFQPGSGLTQYVRNAGNVRSYGIEIEATAAPWRGMELDGSFATLHSRYEAGSFIVNGVAGPVDRSGEAVPQSPKRTYSFGGTQTFDFDWGNASVHLDYYHVSSRNYGQDTPDLTSPTLTAAQRQALITNYAISNQLATLKGYGLLNGRVAVQLNSPNIELAVWGKNLTKTRYNQNLFNSYTGLGIVEQYQAAPRTYGATATFRF